MDYNKIQINHQKDYESWCHTAALAQMHYHTLDQPKMSDRDYDILIRKIREAELAHPEWLGYEPSVTQKVGGDLKPGLYQVFHQSPMLSLDNVFTAAELQEYLDDWLITKIHVSFKYDGLAISLVYRNQQLIEAATRGDGVSGESVLHNVKNVKGVPNSLPAHAPDELEVRGELVMFDDEFARYNERRAALGLPLAVNPRNAAAGIARRLHSEKLPGATLVFIPYGVTVISYHGTKPQTHSQALALLSQYKFDMSWSSLAPVFHYSKDSPLELVDYLNEREKERTTLPFGTDGLVFRIDDYVKCNEIGQTARAPRWAIAYKFPAEEKITIVNDIRVQIGRTGNVTPVADVEPVVVGGVTVSSITLHNEDQIKKLNVTIGDSVIIRRAGDVIPEIVSVARRPKKRVEWVFPTKCECGAKIERPPGLANHICTGGASCKFQILRTFEHFVSRGAFEIDGVGPELIAALTDAGKLKEFSDFFKLKEEDILAVTSDSSEKIAANVIASIQNCRRTTLARFLYALGIPMVGETTAKRLAEWFGSLDLISRASPILLRAVPDIGKNVAESIVRYFGQNSQWNNLRLTGVEITDEIGPSPDFAKYQNIRELLLLADIQGVTPKRVDSIVTMLDQAGYPGHRAVMLDKDDPEFRKAQEFLQENHRTLVHVAWDWTLVHLNLSKVRQVHNNQPLAGSTYVITGEFDDTLGSREKISRMLEDLGAKVVGNVSKFTTALFVGNNPGNKKSERAKALNVPTLSVHDLRELLAKHSF